MACRYMVRNDSERAEKELEEMADGLPVHGSQ